MKKTSTILFLIVLFSVLIAPVSLADKTSASPTTCSGQWTTCSNAFSNDANRSTFVATNTLNGSGIWRGYSLSVPSSASITNVTVRADFFASNVRGFVKLRVSGDGGLTYGPIHSFGGNTAESIFNIDLTNDLTWNSQMLNTSNLRVNATCFKSPLSSTNPTCRLDWTQVNVTYTPFDYSLSSSPSSASIAQARSATSGVSVTLTGGVGQIVSLSTSNCPTGASCFFSPSSGTAGFLSNLTVMTSSSTPAGSYAINITGIGDGKSRSTFFTLNITDSVPIASANAIPTSGQPSLIVNFTGSAIGGDAPLNYLWDFKDGTNSTQQNPQHTFTASGVYNVTLSVTDFDGDSSTNSVVVSVDSLPVVNPSADQTSGTSPLMVNFNGSVSGGDVPLTFLWDFKDGSNSTLQNPQHTFSSSGSYNVSLTATDFDGDSSTGYVLITVSVPFDYSISANPSSGSVVQARSTTTNATLTLLNGSSENVTLSQSGCPPSAICSFNANSGFPTFISLFTVSTASSTPAGNYAMSVNGTSTSGLKKYFSYNLTVTDSQPISSPSANPTSGIAPLTVNFTGGFSGGDSPFTYLWNFGDFSSSNDQDPQHTYNTSGNFTASFRVTDFDGDQSTSNITISVT